MAQRPVEIIDKAIAADTAFEKAMLLAKAGIASGLPRFARDAMREVPAEEQPAPLRAQAEWLEGNYKHVIELAGAAERSGAIDLELAALGSKAFWRMRDYAGASRLGRLAVELASDQDGLTLPELRGVRWMSAYFDVMAGDARESGWLVNRSLIERWQQAPAAQASIIGCFDYKGPDLAYASANLGDFIQTAAVLRHVARFDHCDVSCDQPPLRHSMQRLGESWSEEERIETTGTLHLAIFDRDAPQSIATRFPGREVWAVYNGWFYHHQFGKPDAFPPPDNLRPIPIGFHLWRPSDLSPALLDWLRRYAPIGCRDRNTVRWLLNQGVDAFLSGCPTMTLASSGVPCVQRHGRCKVDLKHADDGESWDDLTHQCPELRTSCFAESLEQALDRLDHYAGLEEVETSRLHCLLPCQALGTPVRFLPGKENDRRFEGLVDITSEDTSDLRKRMTDLLGKVLKPIIEGERSEHIYGLWREMTEPLAIAAKDELFGKNAPPPPGQVDPALLAPAPGGEMVTIAMAFDAGYAKHAQTVLASIRAHSERPIRLVFLVRGIEDAQLEPLSQAADAAETRIFHMDGRLEGTDVELLQKITISTMDRLFLAELLPDLDRIVYIDCDTIMLGDVGELAAYDPGPSGLAARPTPNPNVSRIVEMLERSVAGMPARKANDLRSELARQIDLVQPGFNAGVLVMSLDRLRAKGTFDRAIDLVRRFGLHDQDALNFASLEGYAALPARWNSIPQFDIDPEAALIHWVGARKPWMKTTVLCQEKWQAYAKDLGPRPDPGLSGKKITKQHWLRAGSYRKDWVNRASQASRWIAPDSRVLDLGCGAHLSLKQELPQGCFYQGLDQRSWSEDVIAMDLDTGDFPGVEYDVVVMLGLLEYLSDPGNVLANAAAAAPRLIASYCHSRKHGDPALRERRGWTNAFGRTGLARLLENSGWQIETTKTYRVNENIRELLYRCSRR